MYKSEEQLESKIIYRIINVMFVASLRFTSIVFPIVGIALVFQADGIVQGSGVILGMILATIGTIISLIVIKEALIYIFFGRKEEENN